MDSGETLHVTVTPLQAAIIELFSQQRMHSSSFGVTPLYQPNLLLTICGLFFNALGRWTPEELSTKLGGPDSTAISLALMYWQMTGVIEAVSIEVDSSEAGDDGSPLKKIQTVFDLRESLGEKGSSMGARKCCAFPGNAKVADVRWLKFVSGRPRDRTGRRGRR